VPYHVELRRSRRHARLFNLSEEELRRTVIEPWKLGEQFELAGHRWERRDAQLRILEGPALAAVDLAHGQGWDRAERTARDVTQTMLAARDTDAVAVLAPTEEAAVLAAELLEGLGLRAVDWTPLRRAIVAWLWGSGAAGLDAGAVLIVCVPDAPDWWLLDTGLALGALGPRAVLVKAGSGPPPAVLRDLDIVTVDERSASDSGDLEARLRRAGATTRER